MYNDCVCILQDANIIVVPLLSQDIMGLGFNVDGNMKEGIFVSKIHKRGPAHDTGLISVGKIDVSPCPTHTWTHIHINTPDPPTHTHICTRVRALHRMGTLFSCMLKHIFCSDMLLL